MVSKLKIDGDLAQEARKTVYSTQEAMAKDSQAQSEPISERTIITIENGKEVKESTLRTYAKLIGKPLEELRSTDGQTSENEVIGNIDLTKKNLFGVANKTTLGEYETFIRAFGEKPNFHTALTLLENYKDFKKLTVIANAVPVSYSKMFEAMSEKPQKLFSADNNNLRASESEFDGALSIANKLIWYVQDDLVVPREAIDILKEFKTKVELPNPSKSDEFSVEWLTSDLEARLVGKEYIDNLEANFGLGFFYGKLESGYFVRFPKSQEREHERDAPALDCVSNCERSVLALGSIKNSSINIHYTQRVADIPFYE